MKILIIINDPPYGTERCYNALRLALALRKDDSATEITVFLMADAVAAAKSGQKTPEGYYSVERMLKGVLAGKGQVWLCGTCMDARGLTLNQIRRSSRQEFHPLSLLQREIDRLFDTVAQGVPASTSLGTSQLMVNMDVAETDKEIELTAELPGLDPKDVDISIADDVLTIKGEKKSEKEDKGKNYSLVERSYGSFMRSVQLPAGVDADSIKASFDNGVLKVTVPKPAAAKAKKITVNR